MSKRAPRQKLMTGQIKFNIPRLVEEKWRQWAQNNLVHGEQKQLGIALVTLAMSMPEELRAELIDWGRSAERHAHIAGNHEAFFVGFADRIRAEIERRHRNETTGKPISREMEWFIDRILTPEFLAPRPEDGDDERRQDPPRHRRAV